VDPVGACVGLRGIRVKNIVRELGGEKIDIVRWNDNIETLVRNSLQPAELTTVEVDEATQTVNVKVHQDQLSLAIGKKGQNARLTSKLTGWKIDISRDESAMGFEERVAMAIETLAAIDGISEQEALVLVQNGFLSLEGILAAEVTDLVDGESIDEGTAASIRLAAEKSYEKQFGSSE
jgi:N utilization substance protein A